MTDVIAAPTRAAPADAAVPATPDGARNRPVLAGLLALAGAGTFGLAVVLDVLGRDIAIPPDAVLGPGWSSALVGLILVGAGAAVVRVRSRHPLAWVMVVSGYLWILSGLGSSWFVLAYAGAPGPDAGLSFQVTARYCAVILVSIPLLLLLFPDGRLPRPRGWRLAALGGLAGTALLPVTLVFVPVAELDAYNGTASSPELLARGIDTLSIAMPFWSPVLTAAFVVLPVSLVVPLVVVVGRFRRARGVRRLQMRWLLWAGLIDVVVVGLVSLPGTPGAVGDAVFFLAVALTAGVIALALARTRLTVVDRLLPATVVAVVLAGGVLVVDVVVLLTVGALVGDRDAALLAVTIVAVAYTPLRTWLWTTAHRVVRGTRHDPAGTLTTLADRLESAAAPDAQLAALARSVAEAFRLPGVRVEVDRADGARAIVEHGRSDALDPADDTVVELPLRYRDEPVGRVALAASAYAALSARDQRLLADLLRQAAAAARAGALGASLQQARADLVTAREEERRRLRNDLHDSVGPALGAVTLRIETARELAPVDPAAADAMLVKATSEVTTLLAEVRRLVHDLRPPTLDELGLLGALRARTRALSSDDLTVTVDGADPGELNAAVEVAAFRIVSEALTNVVRHAHATRARVVVEREPGALVVTITDDGCGIGAGVAAGVGSRSLRERSAELGGATTVTCPESGGTVVRAVLPVAGWPA